MLKQARLIIDEFFWDSSIIEVMLYHFTSCDKQSKQWLNNTHAKRFSITKFLQQNQVLDHLQLLFSSGKSDEMKSNMNMRRKMELRKILMKMWGKN